jgi:hypothetical protein
VVDDTREAVPTRTDRTLCSKIFSASARGKIEQLVAGAEAGDCH